MPRECKHAAIKSGKNYLLANRDETEAVTRLSRAGEGAAEDISQLVKTFVLCFFFKLERWNFNARER